MLIQEKRKKKEKQSNKIHQKSNLISHKIT